MYLFNYLLKYSLKSHCDQISRHKCKATSLGQNVNLLKTAGWQIKPQTRMRGGKSENVGKKGKKKKQLKK